MARDLRTDARQYTEPISIINIERQVVDGQILDGVQTERKAFANVIFDVELSKTGNNSNTGESNVQIEIHSPKGIVLKAFKTQIKIREELYKVIMVNQFNINSESIIVTAKGI